MANEESGKDTNDELTAFGAQLFALIQTFAGKAMKKEDTQELLSELLDQALTGGLAMGYHPKDLIATLKERAKELAKTVKMVCEPCKGKGTVPAMLGPAGAIYECRSCDGAGSIALKIEEEPKPSRVTFSSLKIEEEPEASRVTFSRSRGNEPEGEKDYPTIVSRTVEGVYDDRGVFYPHRVTEDIHTTAPETPKSKATSPLDNLTQEQVAALARSRRES